ncbi:OLC1v1022449C1 [Oldenlandia corymbosa var. corymbosa]|uniref:OLC1v1022449C1 n=1 Tax=Oldenlandia corymbosa var. corymbosa TaxID=529605 RepID=A0AAV1BY31_OLDCO|nr:OLC1v1022449C1 [Oldenlandia corymbosa var. corymbosa]
MAEDNNGDPPPVQPPDQKKSLEVTGVEEEEENDSPIEQVRMTVSTKDDPTQSVLTFRTWTLGLAACIILAFVDVFFSFRNNQLWVDQVAAQIVTLPLGKLMAATLPNKNIGIPGTKWSFSLNPGPFSLKEHVLITIFATCGANGVYALHIVSSVKVFYKRPFNPLVAFILSQTTMFLGYGWAGMWRKVLVDSPYMWWPENLLQVSLYRTFHEKDRRPKGAQTRLQFFLAMFIISFAYYIVPGYFFPTISCISIACLIWKNSVLAQQIGSGVSGLGIGSFALDWNTVVAFLGNPIATPAFAIINLMVGFFLIVYVIIPIAYWTNTYEAKKFPFHSTLTFDSHGQKYNISRVLNKEFEFDKDGYYNYSKLYMSILFAMSYGMNFATLTATITHVFLFYSGTIWELTIKTATTLKGRVGDIHTRLMKKNYKAVPGWWFHGLLIVVFGLSLFACEGFDRQLQLPWWGLVLAMVLAFTFTLPIGLIQATTNQQPGLNVVTEMIIGYLYPGRPLANVAFKTYGYISMAQAMAFLKDLKIGHYMKIPPKSMFLVQVIGTLVSTSVQFVTTWWLLTSIANICHPSLLPEGSPWTCPGDTVFYQASIIWGVIGPKKMFTKEGIYPQLNYFFILGAVAPIPFWLLSKKYPEKKWLALINMPILLGATSNMPPARSIDYIMYGSVGIFFNVYIYRKYRAWWGKHAYVLGAAMNAGIAFMGILLFVALQYQNISIDWWGNAGDHCPLAKCPTSPGIHVDGCPAF